MAAAAIATIGIDSAREETVGSVVEATTRTATAAGAAVEGEGGAPPRTCWTRYDGTRECV